MKTAFRLLLLMSLTAPTACRTQVHQSEILNSDAELSFLVATRAWEVVEEGRVVGSVVEFEEASGARGFFSVRNDRQQELGLVDVHGRAWRYRAHTDEPEWLGTGTVLEGTCGILDLQACPELFEITLDLLAPEASTPAP